MERKEKILYHQIHPLKLFVDIATALLSTLLLWNHRWILALLVGFLPSLATSALMVLLMDFEKQKRSAFGRYISRFMNGRLEAFRLLGYALMLGGAWYQSIVVIAIGVILILLAWTSGLLHS